MSQEGGKKIVIVGAGVIGLTVAHELLSQHPGEYDIQLVAQHLPGDFAQLYTSPWAGAHWSSPPSEDNPKVQEWHIKGYNKFLELSKNPECWIKPMDLYFGDIPKTTCCGGISKDSKVKIGQSSETEPWFKDRVVDYKWLGSDEKRFPGVVNLHKILSFTISTTFYLTYLMNECIKLGLKVRRHTIKNLAEGYTLPFFPNPDIVINCTGLLFTKLPDCKDEKLHPIRGHVIVLENELPYQFYFEEEDPVKEGEFFMMFPRKEGGLVVGGIYDDGTWDNSIDEVYVNRLKTKTQKYVKEFPGEFKIVRHQVAFRPGRTGGPLISLDKIASINRPVIHNYGCGSLGYIESFGAAEETIKLLDGFFSKKTSSKL
ncbi:hypothetical protein B5S30_g203 [[Candida] boidinii]|nr:hypothetical protein B5S30_g203 [[Candida] boidinii]GMG23281.1 unnamed protein product [[Candida] boidinii]